MSKKPSQKSAHRPKEKVVARLGRVTRSLLSFAIGLGLAFMANAAIIRAFPAAFPWLKAVIMVGCVGITFIIIDKALTGGPGR